MTPEEQAHIQAVTNPAQREPIHRRVPPSMYEVMPPPGMVWFVLVAAPVLSGYLIANGTNGTPDLRSITPAGLKPLVRNSSL